MKNTITSNGNRVRLPLKTTGGGTTDTLQQKTAVFISILDVEPSFEAPEVLAPRRIPPPPQLIASLFQGLRSFCFLKIPRLIR